MELSSFGAGSVTWSSQGCHTPLQGQPGMSHPNSACTGRGQRLSKALQAHCDQPRDQGQVLVIPSLRQHQSSSGCGTGIEFHFWCVTAALKYQCYIYPQCIGIIGQLSVWHAPESQDLQTFSSHQQFSGTTEHPVPLTWCRAHLG